MPRRKRAVLQSLMQFLVRLVFFAAVVVLAIGLLALGLVLALVLGLVALVTRRRPRWGARWQQQTQAWGHQAWRRYGRGRAPAAQGEVVEAEVREVRPPPPVPLG